MIAITNQVIAQMAGVNFDSEEIRPGRIVYSRTHEIRKQFDTLAGYGPCILLTSFSDAPVTESLLQGLPSNVVRWYSNNVMVRNERVRPIPLGYRFSPTVETILRPLHTQGHKKEVGTCCLCCARDIPRRINPRVDIYERFIGLPWVDVKDAPIPMEEFYNDLQTHSYTISPPGAGADCHRHWEALTLGCIPIVIRSIMTEDMFHDMPVLIVDRWDEVTEDRLLYEYPDLVERFGWESRERKIWWEYWRDMILEDIACL